MLIVFAAPAMFHSQLVCPFAAHPKIECEPKLKEVQSLKAESTLILLVNVTGVPTPTVAWYKDGEPLTTSDLITMETTVDFSKVTVKKISSANAGTYKVTAENVVGTAEQEFTVNVKGKVNMTGIVVL